MASATTPPEEAKQPAGTAADVSPASAAQAPDQASSSTSPSSSGDKSPGAGPPPIPPIVRYFVFGALAVLLMGGMGLFQSQYRERRAVEALARYVSIDDVERFRRDYPNHATEADARARSIKATIDQIKKGDDKALARIEQTQPEFTVLIEQERRERAASGTARDQRARNLAAIRDATTFERLRELEASLGSRFANEIAQRRSEVTSAAEKEIDAATTTSELERLEKKFQNLCCADRLRSRRSALAALSQRQLDALTSIRNAQSFADLERVQQALGPAYAFDVNKRKSELTLVAENEIDAASTTSELDQLGKKYQAYCCAARLQARRAELSKSESSGTTSGSQTTSRSPDSVSFNLYFGYDLEGGDRKPLDSSTQTYDACRNKCADASWCNYFSYDLLTQRCYLKDSRPTAARRDGLSISGYEKSLKNLSAFPYGVEVAIRRGKVTSQSSPETRSVSSEAVCYGLCLRDGDPQCNAARYDS
ncbi:MAG: hypothetical protein JSS20_17375, partial [Proteobacteria bacterium]|nr:hypothetical protein [Pseudomonadota bacterium]